MSKGKSPSMSWTTENKLNLLIKYIGQNPNMSYNAEEISRTWEGDPKPSVRAVKNTLTDIRAKAIADAGGVVTRLSRVSGALNSAARSVRAKRPATTTDEDEEDDDNVIKKISGGNSTAFNKRLSATKASTPAKRAKHTAASKIQDNSSPDETSTEDDLADQPDKIKVTPRKTPQRRSKTPKKYTDDNDDDEVDTDADAATKTSAAVEENADQGDDDEEDENFDHVASRRMEQGFNRPRKSFSQKYRAAHVEDSADVEED